MDIPVEWLSKITPGSSYKGVSDLVQKGFNFNTKRKGVTLSHFCRIDQKPQGYCYGAIKHILEKKFQIQKAPYAHAYQEKDHLLQQHTFLAVPINIKDEDKVPQNSFLVIPPCNGHQHGHICWKKDGSTYVSDGVEKAGENFVNNYKGAGNDVYAFIPCDGSITLSREMLQQCPKLLAAIGNKQSSTYMALAYAAQNNRTL